ncbi:PREDICTED: VID27-like protein [Cyphomyrmex costatus]|uniref:VID27-like protein n=1 Tax=Cyphomyrmex costatus TaxID=456900 RepID=UPI0008522C1C|nr:PREDICTED: VID27-like protein [Cyphomyrmex costatus]
MIDDDKTQAMFMSALLSILLILSGIRTVGDGFNYWDFPRSPASDVIMKDIHGCALHIEPLFYGGFIQPPQRRLLEHPRRAKQVYRSYDYNVARGHRQPRNKLDEGRLYRSSAKNDEDENKEEEEEEEENQNGEEDKLNDEDIDEETAEQDEEETVAVADRNRVARSGYVPFRGEADERERQDMRIKSTTEECEEESTEPSQYYEYETEFPVSNLNGFTVSFLSNGNITANSHTPIFYEMASTKKYDFVDV